MARTRRSLARNLALVGGLAQAVLWPTLAAAQDGDGGEERYMRVREASRTGPVRLELAIRTLRPSEDGKPVVHLVGVAHIAQPAYYRTLQSFLDKQDLVLFEGVGPDWARVSEDASDVERADATTGRVRFIGAAAERYHRAMGIYPADARALIESAEPYERRQLADAMTDGWDRPIHYHVSEEGTLELTSLGADGEPGGSGVEADVQLSEMAPISPDEAGAGEGIQSQLASATGLVFQLDSIDYSSEKWINADMTVGELFGTTEGVPGEGEDPGGLMGLLSGESMMAKLMGGVLKLIGSSEYSRAVFRLALIEMLGRSEELMEVAVPQMGGDLFERIIEGRNEVVIEAVREASEGADAPGSIAVFYGSGHMEGLERTLLEEDGYRVSETTWLPAIVVDYDSSGIPARQGAFFRSMIARSLEQQVEAMRRMAPTQD
ncbi:MAG: type II secretion system protein GspG [Phycisphaerales bacterium JB059]